MSEQGSISMVTCVNNKHIYQENVLKSTIAYASRVEYIAVNNPPSGAKGLNKGMDQAQNNLVVCCHQDIYFLDGWLDKMFEQLKMVKEWGVCGLAGTRWDGRMVGCHSGLGMPPYPVEVQTLDCSLIILDKRKRLRFDEGLQYFHMYGEDIALQANELGLGAYVLYAAVEHRTRWSSGPGFCESVAYMKRKWKDKFQRIYTTVGVY